MVVIICISGVLIVIDNKLILNMANNYLTEFFCSEKVFFDDFFKLWKNTMKLIPLHYKIFYNEKILCFSFCDIFIVYLYATRITYYSVSIRFKTKEWLTEVVQGDNSFITAKKMQLCVNNFFTPHYTINHNRNGTVYSRNVHSITSRTSPENFVSTMVHLHNHWSQILQYQIIKIWTLLFNGIFCYVKRPRGGLRFSPLEANHLSAPSPISKKRTRKTKYNLQHSSIDHSYKSIHYIVIM